MSNGRLENTKCASIPSDESHINTTHQKKGDKAQNTKDQIEEGVAFYYIYVVRNHEDDAIECTLLHRLQRTFKIYF